MEYNIDDIKEITNKYKIMRKDIIKKLVEIGKTIGFFDKYWVFEDYEIDFEEEKIYITAYDSGYDGYDTKNMTIPLSWLNNTNWFLEYKKIEDEKEKRKQEKLLEMIKQEEQKEYETYLKLQEKYGNIERN